MFLTFIIMFGSSPSDNFCLIWINQYINNDNSSLQKVSDFYWYFFFNWNHLSSADNKEKDRNGSFFLFFFFFLLKKKELINESS